MSTPINFLQPFDTDLENAANGEVSLDLAIAPRRPRSNLTDGSTLIDDNDGSNDAPPSENPAENPSNGGGSPNPPPPPQSPPDDDDDDSSEDEFDIPTPDEFDDFEAEDFPDGANSIALFEGFRFGTPSRDVAIGSEGENTFLGLDDNDTIFGHGGNDFLSGNRAEDEIYGGDGDDTIVGGQENDRLRGNSGTDWIFGNIGDDRIFGDRGNDILLGGQNDDRILGDRGNDWISGDFGRDILGGGSGEDRFILRSETAIGNTDPDRADLIADFDDDRDRIIIVASFGIEGLTYRELDDFDGQKVVDEKTIDAGDREITFKHESDFFEDADRDSTAIVAPNGDILGVVFGETDVDEIRDRITIVPNFGDAFGI